MLSSTIYKEKLENFEKFTGKQLSWSLFFIQLQETAAWERTILGASRDQRCPKLTKTRDHIIQTDSESLQLINTSSKFETLEKV